MFIVFPSKFYVKLWIFCGHQTSSRVAQVNGGQPAARCQSRTVSRFPARSPSSPATKDPSRPASMWQGRLLIRCQVCICACQSPGRTVSRWPPSRSPWSSVSRWLCRCPGRWPGRCVSLSRSHARQGVDTITNMKKCQHFWWECGTLFVIVMSWNWLFNNW